MQTFNIVTIENNVETGTYNVSEFLAANSAPDVELLNEEDIKAILSLNIKEFHPIPVCAGWLLVKRID